MLTAYLREFNSHEHNGRIINATTPNGKKIKFHPGDVILKEED